MTTPTNIQLQKAVSVRNSAVPCDGCTLCCRGDAISLRPELGDDVSQYQTEPHYKPELAAQGVRMLAHKEDLTCVYLTDAGCSIHGRAPVLCQEFDCRALMKALGPERAVWAIKRGMLSPEIVLRGHELIPTLTA